MIFNMAKLQAITFMVAIGCLPGWNALADDTPAATNKQAPRDYSGRVQMHSVSVEAARPDAKGEAKPTAQEMLGLEPRRTADLFLPESPSLLHVQPPAPARPANKASRKQNWLSPASLNVKTDKEVSDEERRDSGWGWLADDVKTRSDAKETEEENPEDKSSENPIHQEEVSSGPSGLLMEQVFDQRAAADVLKEVGVRDAQELARVDDEGRAEDASDPLKKTDSAPWRQRVSALEEPEAMTRADDPQRRERVKDWLGREKEEPSLMPKTEALFSRTAAQGTDLSLPAGRSTGDQDAGPASIFRPDGANAGMPLSERSEWGTPVKADSPLGSALPEARFGKQASTSLKQGSLFGSVVTPPTFGAPAPAFQPSQGFESGRMPDPLRPWGSPLPSASSTWPQSSAGSR